MANPNPNVLKIVAYHLKEYGFGGLWNEDKNCACRLDDISPSDCLDETCRAGYEQAGCDCGEDCAFHIVPAKPQEASDG